VKADLASLVFGTPGTPGQSQPEPRLRILVVEDDDDIRRLNTEVLNRNGYQVDAAEDGAVAWAALQADRYALMITDNAMPKMTGIELLNKLRTAKMSLPVIMAAGTIPMAEFLRDPCLQPAATLLKPYTLDELVGTVREVLRETRPVGERAAHPSAQPMF
jgi:DNA-binding response OmpR family regulator